MIRLRNESSSNEELWLTSAEAQQFFRVSRSTLYRWCKTKKLPYTKQGGVLYYPKKFIEQLMINRMRNNHLRPRKE
ncbi:helix-turn-helix domain-containing protein [Mariniflexile sp. HMF6888]|uniref:helix-turn-helix domain-containing protein n=1 Tax=Mariniflexile sp. HMF6888 TaxID=3373086 RepID=UPI0037B00704